MLDPYVKQIIQHLRDELAQLKKTFCSGEDSDVAKLERGLAIATDYIGECCSCPQIPAPKLDNRFHYPGYERHSGHCSACRILAKIKMDSQN